MSDGANRGDVEQASEYIVVFSVPRSDEPTKGDSVLGETVPPPTCVARHDVGPARDE